MTTKEDTVTHQEIFDRVLAMEAKVNCIATSTAGVVKAFEAAQGSFTVLETMSKVAKPLLWLAGCTPAVQPSPNTFAPLKWWPPLNLN